MGKKRILLATDSYNGKCVTANGICVQYIAKEFAKHNYEVDIICYKHPNEQTHEIVENINLNRIRPNLVNKLRFAYETGENNSFRKIFKKCMVALNRIQTLLFINWFPMRNPLFCRRYAKEMEKLCLKKKYDIILASYCPFEAIYSAWKIKKKYNVITCMYSLDSLSNFLGNRFFMSEKSQREKGYRWEGKFFRACDLILNMKCHKEYYNQQKYSIYTNKFRYVDFPHIVTTHDDYEVLDSNLLLYAGSVRTSYFTEVITLLHDVLLTGYRLEIYGGNTDRDLGVESKQMNLMNIYLKGRVEHEMLLKIEEMAVCFISMGNYGNSSNFVPSKIFEYIATGKKIIHFYKNENDSCVPYLKRYDGCCLINVNEDMDKSKAIIRKFLDSPFKPIDAKQIKKVFNMNTPEYTYKIINDYFESKQELVTIKTDAEEEEKKKGVLET